VEAAAMAGISHLCDGDVEDTVRQIAQENGLPSGTESLTVLIGFYDDFDEFGDFAIYRDFAADGAGDYPDGEYNNAVMVSLDADVSTFIAGIFGRDQVRVKAEAVSYQRRIGMAAINDDSVIRLDHDSSFHNGDIYSNGIIEFQDSDCTRDTWWGPRTNAKPVFVNSNLYAREQVLEYPMNVVCTIDWDSGVESTMDNAFSHSPRLTKIKPCDDEYIESLRETADVVYEISDAATDTTFWGRNADSTNFAFDLTGERADREVIFFDAQGNDVLISEGSYCLGCGGGGCVYYNGDSQREPNGDRIYNVTFITNGNIIMDRSAWNLLQIWGAEGDQQAVIITSGNIQITGNVMEGIVYRCGGLFGTISASDNGGDDKVRIIADERIMLAPWRRTTRHWHANTEFKFGPPCPFGGGAYLGKLEPAGE